MGTPRPPATLGAAGTRRQEPRRVEAHRPGPTRARAEAGRARAGGGAGLGRGGEGAGSRGLGLGFTGDLAELGVGG